MKKDLTIIGFTGTIGSALVKELEQKNRRLFLINRKGIYKKEIDSLQKELVSEDPYNYDALKNIFLKSSECICLINSYPQDKSLTETILGEIQTNACLVGFFAKIAAETEIERFILTSTTAMFYVLGDREEEINEDSALKIPDNFILDKRGSYAFSKYLAENLVKKIIPTERLLILRIDNIFGVGSKEFTIIPKFIRQILDGENLEVFDWTRSFIYLDDVVKVLLDVLNKREITGVLNICNPENTIRLCDLANLIKKFFPNSPTAISINNNTKEPYLKFSTKYLPNFSLTSLEEGIEKIIRQ